MDYTSVYYAIERRVLDPAALFNLPLLLASAGWSGGPCSWDPWAARLLCAGRIGGGLAYLAVCVGLVGAGLTLAFRGRAPTGPGSAQS